MWRNYTILGQPDKKYMLCNKCYCRESKIKAKQIKALSLQNSHNHGGNNSSQQGKGVVQENVS